MRPEETDEMKLYTHGLSPYSAKVRIALDEKGIAFEEIAVPLRRAGMTSKPVELLASNPRGQVPTLLDGGVTLYDSTVIVEYLEEKQPEPRLFPKDRAERARARLAEDDGDHLMNGAVAQLIAETFRKPDPATRDEQRIEEAAAQIHAALDRLEQRLDGNDYVTGAFGAADAAWFMPVTCASLCGVPPTDRHPHVAAWIARMNGRASVARTMALMMETLQKVTD
jgi:glutathione S-transferase